MFLRVCECVLGESHGWGGRFCFSEQLLTHSHSNSNFSLTEANGSVNGADGFSSLNDGMCPAVRVFPSAVRVRSRPAAGFVDNDHMAPY